VAESFRIDADEQWFVGEDRILQFDFISGDTYGIEDWTIAAELYARRAVDGDAPLATFPAVATSVVAADPEADPPVLAVPARATVTVDGDDTTDVGPGVYQLVLRRTDTGLRTVLAYGPVELRSVVNA
jgi:hypothetical protein